MTNTDSTSLPSTIHPTVATNALRKQRSLLLSLIRHCLPEVANSLYTKYIIPKEVCELVCNENKGTGARGVALLDCVESRIEAVPSDFTKVVHILEADGFLEPGAEELVKSYQESINQKLVNVLNVDDTISNSVDIQKRTRDEQVDLPLAFFGDEDFNFESVPVNTTSEIVVHLNLSNVDNHLGNHGLHAKLTFEHLTETVAIKRMNSNTYSLLLIPQKRGKHKLLIQYNSEHICGSPIPEFATTTPDQLARIAPTVRELNGIVAIKFFGGKLYATEDDIALVVMDSLATRVESRFEVPNILEIAIGGGFYYATVKRCTVIKMDATGNILKSIGRPGTLPGEFRIVNGITYKDGELYVCDTGNQVFDEDLNFIRSLGTCGPGRNCLSKPDNIVLEEDGNMYVVEEGNDRVQVLTPMCRHIRFIGAPGSGGGELHKPVAVAIFRDLIYILEFGNRRVSVFTKTGGFVSTFADGLFSEPDNIIVDDNGYIYVTDLKSKLYIF